MNAIEQLKIIESDIATISKGCGYHYGSLGSPKCVPENLCSDCNEELRWNVQFKKGILLGMESASLQRTKEILLLLSAFDLKEAIDKIEVTYREELLKGE